MDVGRIKTGKIMALRWLKLSILLLRGGGKRKNHGVELVGSRAYFLIMESGGAFGVYLRHGGMTGHEERCSGNHIITNNAKF